MLSAILAHKRLDHLSERTAARPIILEENNIKGSLNRNWLSGPFPNILKQCIKMRRLLRCNTCDCMHSVQCIDHVREFNLMLPHLLCCCFLPCMSYSTAQYSAIKPLHSLVPCCFHHCPKRCLSRPQPLKRSCDFQLSLLAMIPSHLLHPSVLNLKDNIK